jgi:quinol monooxygenase YgiN
MAYRIDGQIVCADEREAAAVRDNLALHAELTRAEPGCVRFSVEPTDDPFVFAVSEEFADKAAFEAHQARAGAAAWGPATKGIERRFTFADDAA